MKLILRLAWRNIWRKKKRSLIAILSIIFAVVISITFRSLQWGSYDKMIEAGTKNSGYLQLQNKNYWEDKSINELIPYSESIIERILSISSVTSIIPRLQNYSLAASGNSSKGVLVIGIEPKAENKFNQLSDRVIKGDYIFESDNAALVSEGLSTYLNVSINDTLVLISQGLHATIAAGKYPIKGIVKLSNSQLNQTTVYLPLITAQLFNNANDLISAYMILQSRTLLNQQRQISLIPSVINILL